MIVLASTQDITENAKKGLKIFGEVFDNMTKRLFQAVRTCEEEFDVAEWSATYLHDPENAVRNLEAAARAAEEAQHAASGPSIWVRINAAVDKVVADIKVQRAKRAKRKSTAKRPRVDDNNPDKVNISLCTPQDGGEIRTTRLIDGVEYEFIVHF